MKQLKELEKALKNKGVQYSVIHKEDRILVQFELGCTSLVVGVGVIIMKKHPTHADAAVDVAISTLNKHCALGKATKEKMDVNKG